jgi:hypothetical protein
MFRKLAVSITRVDTDDGDRTTIRNVGFNLTLTWLIAREKLIQFIHRESSNC